MTTLNPPSSSSSSSSSTTSTTNPTTTPPTSPPSTTPPLRPIFLTLLIACPILMLLPPRKLDLYTFSLAGAFAVSAEEVTIGSARRSTGALGRRGRVDGAVSTRPGVGIGGVEGGEGREKGDEEEEGVKGLAKKLWMGDEGPGWQRRRLEREREELESGKGYGDIIMEQVREVFPGFGGRRKEEDGEEREG